jgi:hypothetical protein
MALVLLGDALRERKAVMRKFKLLRANGSSTPSPITNSMDAETETIPEGKIHWGSPSMC